ncbi:MAG: HAD hydrolase-like protein [Patescibacteria group bacterium]
MIERINQLWIIDIDGTIVNVHTNQVPAWLNMLKEVYGVEVDEKTLVSFFGKPFTSVLVDVLEHSGIKEEDVLKKHKQAFDKYVYGVQSGLDKNGGKILPGAVEFLEELGRRHIVRAIATGNPQSEAEHKLKYFDLLKYFEIKVYAENRRERSELVHEAVRQAHENFGISPKGREIKIFGDSPHDVKSAHKLEALSIGIATGPTSYEKLAAIGPDLIFPSLTEYRKIIEQVLNS